MKKWKEPSIAEDELMKAIGKSEVLIEEHEQALDDLEENTEDFKQWLLFIFRAVKEAIL